MKAKVIKFRPKNAPIERVEALTPTELKELKIEPFEAQNRGGWKAYIKVWALALGFIIGFAINAFGLAKIMTYLRADTTEYKIGVMPQLPFEIEDAAYKKTISVEASCAKNPSAVTLRFKGNDVGIASMVYAAVNKAFDKPGITIVQICRTNTSSSKSQAYSKRRVK